jgi:diacylglycerol kinase (ATP)
MTGNDLARELGLPRNDLPAAADVILTGVPRVIDTARAGERSFVTVLASGFDSRVSERANTMRRPRGQLRYTLATLAELRVFQPVLYTLTLDGSRLSVEAMLVAVGNTSSYGGGLRMCEGARVDDGLLDVVVIAPMSKLDLIRLYPRLFTGSHVRHSAFSRHRVRRVTLEAATDVIAHADGERLGELPVTVAVAAQSVQVMVAAA